MSKRDPLQAHNAQRIYHNGIFSRNREYERVEYNTRTCSVKGVRRIIRKRGELAEQVIQIAAPKPAAKKSERRKSNGKRIKASRVGKLQAATLVLTDGWLLEPAHRPDHRPVGRWEDHGRYAKDRLSSH